MINRWLIRQHLRFTSKTFPKGTALGAILHAERECREVQEDIKNQEIREKLIEEYADVFGCLIDSVNRSGITRRELNRAFSKKLEKNKKRVWKDNEDGSYSHVKQEQNKYVPLLITLMALPIKVLETKNEPNLATGEITKFKFVESQRNKQEYGKQLVGSEKGYDRIWIHIKNDWFKEIGKYPERTC